MRTHATHALGMTARASAWLCAFAVLLACFAPACGQPDTVQANPEHPRSDCYACHADDYFAVHHPQHAGEKPTACAICHLETGWTPSEVHHPWPLTGAHAKTDCFACHSAKPPVFRGTDEACVACHRQDYERSEYPGHDHFPLTCADCHSTSAFKPAERPKPAESNGKLEDSLSETEHEKDAGSPAEPPVRGGVKKPKTPHQHKTGQASLPADDAHSSASKALGDASHAVPPTPAPAREHPEDRFPIASGHHARIECAECHALPGQNSKANTSCVSCHKRSRYDSLHQSVAAYPLDGAANFCVQCHTHGSVKPVSIPR